MKFGNLLSIIGAAGMLTVFSLHTAHADVTVAATAVSADQNEARLTKTIELPEPASWTMLIMGFGAIGAVARRGRAQRLRAASIG
jgi:hypothetical protein